MLVPEQCRRANALQKKGLMLREIAAPLGVSFEDVALYLYGGIADWAPLGRALPLDDNQEDESDDRDVDAGRAGGVAGRRHGTLDAVHMAPGGGADTTVDVAEAIAPAAPAAGGVRNPADPSPPPEPPRTPQPPAEPAQPQDPHAHPAPVAPPAPAAPPEAPEPVARRYRLTNGAGEYLHKSGSSMTRNKDAAWVGTAPQMEEAFKRKPTLKDLDPERAP